MAPHFCFCGAAGCGQPAYRRSCVERAVLSAPRGLDGAFAVDKKCGEDSKKGVRFDPGLGILGEDALYCHCEELENFPWSGTVAWQCRICLVNRQAVDGG